MIQSSDHQLEEQSMQGKTSKSITFASSVNMVSYLGSKEFQKIQNVVLTEFLLFLLLPELE